MTAARAEKFLGSAQGDLGQRLANQHQTVAVVGLQLNYWARWAMAFDLNGSDIGN